MAQSDLRPVAIIGPPGGIDQSENPKPRTVRDCCNIDTSRGLWETRPGLRSICKPLNAADVGNLLAEYVPDRRFETSHYRAVLVGCVDDTAQTIKEVLNPEAFNTLTGHGQTEGWWKRFAFVRGLWKYDKGQTKSDGTIVAPDYTPVILLSNGYDPPCVYHQKDGAGAVSPLDALDGGESIGYLRTPPYAKVLATYKERVFAANVERGANRMFWTGPDSALTFTVNVWPAKYFVDIGGGDEEITALIPFKDQLVIFKENSIYVLGGDGVGGRWAIDLVDNQHGAVNTHCVANIGNALIFIAQDGIYMWAGGQARCISHPWIQDLWKEMDWTEGKLKRLFAAHDSMKHLVYFGCGQTSEAIDSYIVYDYIRDAWSRWGAWPGKHRDVFPIAWPQWSGEVPSWNEPDSRVLSIYDGHLCAFKPCHDVLDTPVTVTAANKWIDIDDGGGEDNCSIAEKQYSSYYAVAAAIQAAIRTGTGDATFTVTYDASTSKFTIARPVGNFDILWDTGVNTGNTVGGILGFSVAADDKSANSYLADNTTVLASEFAIHWFLKTQRHFGDDSFFKTLRHFVASIKNTGDWKLLAIALKDDEDFEDALKRDAGTKNNIIVDSANAQEHTVGGTSQFQLATDGPVDVYNLETLIKVGDSLTLVASSGTDKIKFSAALDSTGLAGKLLVLPEDTGPRRTRDMYDALTELFGYASTYGTYDDAVASSPRIQKRNIGMNAFGRAFSVFLTNVGEVTETYSFGTMYAKRCSILSMDGWELWVVPTQRLRPLGS
jgi:hypothetical protein